jgi:hypothetical protein
MSSRTPEVRVPQVEYHWSRGNALDLYSVGARFESRPGHQLS